MRRATAFTVLAFSAACTFAAEYPAKAVRIITPFPPGGSVDLVARLIGADLAKPLGQQVVIDNRTGASGMIGTELAKNAAPDGYTLFVGHKGTHSLYMLMAEKPEYDECHCCFHELPPRKMARVPAVSVTAHRWLHAVDVRRCVSASDAARRTTRPAGARPPMRRHRPRWSRRGRSASWECSAAGCNAPAGRCRKRGARRGRS